MTDKKTEALKLALEALEECRRDPRLKYEHPYYDKAITAIREALAEQCVCGEPDTPGTHRTDGPCLAEQPAQQQEPVAKVVTDNSRELIVESLNSKYLRKGTKLYTSPPASKPWAGLTDEDIQEVRENCGITHHAIKTIEAKLKEKNT